MNWDQVKGDWKQLRGNIKEKWGKLTDNDLTVIDGKKDQLVGALQKRYGYEKEQAERALDDFVCGINPQENCSPSKSDSCSTSSGQCH